MFQYFKNFLKHSMVYSIGNGIYRAAAFILIPLYTKTLLPADYGTLEMFYVISGVLRMFLGMMLAHATLRFYFEFDEELERKRVVSTSFISSVVFTTLITAVMLGFSPQLSLLIFKTVQYQTLFPLVFGLVVLELSKEIGLAYLRAKEKSLFYIVLAIIQLISQVSLNIYFVLVRHMGVRGILLGNLLSTLLVWLVISVCLLRYCGMNFHFPKLKLLIRYCMPFVFATAAAVVINNADRVMLNSYRDLATVGVYALALKFGVGVRELFIEPFNMNFGQARFSIMKDKSAKKIYSLTLTYFCFVIVFLSLAISFFAKNVVRLISAPGFWDSYRLVPVVLLSVFVTGTSYILQTGILISKKTKYMFFIMTATAVVTLIFNFLLIPAWGSYGAAIATLLASIVNVALTYLIANRLYPVRFEIGRVGKIVAAAVVLYAVSYWTALLWHLPSGAELLFKSVLLMCFPVSLYAVAFFNEGERAKIKAFCHKINTALRRGLGQVRSYTP